MIINFIGLLMCLLKSLLILILHFWFSIHIALKFFVRYVYILLTVCIYDCVSQFFDERMVYDIIVKTIYWCAVMATTAILIGENAIKF